MADEGQGETIRIDFLEPQLQLRVFLQISNSANLRVCGLACCCLGGNSLKQRVRTKTADEKTSNHAKSLVLHRQSGSDGCSRRDCFKGRVWHESPRFQKQDLPKRGSDSFALPCHTDFHQRCTSRTSRRKRLPPRHPPRTADFNGWGCPSCVVSETVLKTGSESQEPSMPRIPRQEKAALRARAPVSDFAPSVVLPGFASFRIA